MTRNETIQSIWARIEVGGLSECWPWIGHISIYGYGTDTSIYYEFGTNRVHRAIYLLTWGELESSLQVLHSCDNRKCCNPTHLSQGTHLDNMRDMRIRGRASHHKVPQPGSANGNAILTDEKVLAIRSDNRRLREISKDYGVSKARISQIKLRKCWRHL